MNPQTNYHEACLCGRTYFGQKPPCPIHDPVPNPQTFQPTTGNDRNSGGAPPLILVKGKMPTLRSERLIREFEIFSYCSFCNSDERKHTIRCPVIESLDYIRTLESQCSTIQREKEQHLALLARCLKKLRIMNEQTGYEYGGGEPMQILAPDIEKAISSLTPSV